MAEQGGRRRDRRQNEPQDGPQNGPQNGPGPSVKDDATYDALRRDGASKEKAARIANASADPSRGSVSRKGGRAGSYDDWSKDDLQVRARELEVEGRSSMTKDELIAALRDR